MSEIPSNKKPKNLPLSSIVTRINLHSSLKSKMSTASINAPSSKKENNKG